MTPSDAIRLAVALLLVQPLSVPLMGQTVLLSVQGAQDEPFFGTSVSDAGDLDGDGQRDLVVGDPYAGPLTEGRAEVLSGTTGAILFGWSGQTPGEEYGTSVAGGIDADGDGVPDILVGSPLASHNGSSSGSAWLRSGVDGGVLSTWNGPVSDAHFGAAVAFAGDVNFDGFCDVVVGAPREGPGSRGAVRIFSGRDGTLLRLYTGDANFDTFGSAVANAGDVDADGLVDLIVGAPQNASAPGYARVYRGDDGSVLDVLGTDASSDLGGSSVAGPGDVDGDGFDDLLVGVPGFDLPLPDAGAAVVFSGLTGGVLRLFPGSQAMDAYGHAVSSVGDVDGDGLADVAAATDSPFGGRVHVHSVVSGQTLLTVLPLGETGTEPLSGLALAPGADSNGDGIADLVIGVPRRIISSDPGEVLVVSSQLIEGWQDLGGALPGRAGSPSLQGVGDPTSDNPFVLQLEGALPHAPTTFVLGLQQLDLPFKGGHLMPSPDLVLSGFTVDAQGALRIEATGSRVLPPGTTLVFQAWIADPVAPLGFAASNGLQSKAR